MNALMEGVVKTHLHPHHIASHHIVPHRMYSSSHQSGLALTIPTVHFDPELKLPSKSGPDGEDDDYEARYKEAKEAFYAGNDGGSSWEVVMVTAVAPVSVWSIQVLQVVLVHLERVGT